MEKINVTCLEREQFIKLLRNAGCREMSAELLEADIVAGFPTNENGTIDLFDYVVWLVGDKTDIPSQHLQMNKELDLNSINPTELVGFLNSYNHLGRVVKRSRVTLVFQMYKFRLADKKNERNINFLKYAAFVASPAHRKKSDQQQDLPRGYEAHKDEMNRRQMAQSAAGRDIGPLPAVVNKQRKSDCEVDFKLFCESYFPHTFELKWSDDHIRCIEKIETAVLHGGLFALAMPRGSGKTSLAECAGLWAMLYGHREFVTLVGATETAAVEILDSIKIELETNELLADDFPEVCFPIAALQGINNRCAGQLYQGKRTRISWTGNEIVLPTIEGSKASGIVVRVAGITGRIRGMKYKRPDGKAVRPSLVIIDDPQTRESAGSVEQNRKRTNILAGDILGLAGPGQKISGIMPCTIIRPGDMADQILDRSKHPEWNGEKTKMLYQKPANMKLWERYSEIRADSYQTDGNFQRATDFYLANREEMDKGAVVSWPERFNHDEVSALQHAMNLMFQDEYAFAAEYQNEPLIDDLDEESILTTDEIVQKLSGLGRGKIPLSCSKVTMFVDVQKALLFYMVVAWSDDFSGTIIDYGTWPEQRANRFTLSNAYPTIQMKFPRQGLDGQLYSALTELFQRIMPIEWEREDGALLKIERAMIDANWGASTEVVYQFCRQSIYSGMIFPSHGRYVGASSRPMMEYTKSRGDKVGVNWRIPSVAGKRAIRHVIYDTNYWKSFVHARLAVALGDKGCLTLYGRSPLVHELLAEHLTAEYRVKVSARERVVDEWKIRPERNDNHWFDCLVGCAVLASMLGARTPEQMPDKMRQGGKMSLSATSSGRSLSTSNNHDSSAKNLPGNHNGERKKTSLSELYKIKYG